MLSMGTLRLIDTVASTGSFSAAAKVLHKVPSAISYSVRQIEEEIGAVLFLRHHRHVSLTDAGVHLVAEARSLLRRTDEVIRETQRLANGWQPSLSIALDNIVSADRIGELMADFYRTFDNVELILRIEVYNGVWEALSSGLSDIAIGATTEIPVGGKYQFRQMGSIDWVFLVGRDHPLAARDRPLSDDELARYPAICLEDTARTLPKRSTWLLPRQRRLVVPDWQRAIDCYTAGLGIGYLPVHLAQPYMRSGVLLKKDVLNPKASSLCCVAWREGEIAPALSWVLGYLGECDKLQREWIS